jgi:quercetin dioxygenase-like cupin family protein
MKAEAFELHAVAAARAEAGEAWFEFLRVPALSMGIYVLEAGADDPQTPHSEDEVYYVVGGRGRLRAGDTDFEAEAGNILFVPAQMPHAFHTIQEQLTVLVFFAPSEYSLADAAHKLTPPELD